MRAGAPSAEPALTPEEETLLAEDVDLEPDVRRSVLLTYRGLDTRDHYEALGVPRSADRKALKRAYFDMAARFHPDKYFRKKLGSYKLRMEAIFGRITLAHDTLTNREKRAEYDAYLDEQRRSRSIEDLMADAMAEVQRAAATVEAEASEVSVAAPNPASPSASTSTTSSGTRPVDPAIRREALARKLLAGRAPPGKTSSNPSVVPVSPSPPPPPSRSDAMDALRRRYEERKAMAQAAQARRYVTNAEAATATGDHVGAANALRVALALMPADADLERRAREAQQRADSILAETYAKQGSYEEKNGQWVEAARSWGRVAKAKPEDAPAHEHAANALLKASGDLHEASRLAKRACELEPKKASYRVTLANVYLAAGLALNARRELETAAQLAPHDDTIQGMLKRVGKPA